MLKCENTDISHVLAVNQLMTIEKNAWNVDKLKELFDEAIMLAIKKHSSLVSFAEKWLGVAQNHHWGVLC
jgi:hypothetical protein